MPDRLLLFYNRYWDIDPAEGIAAEFTPGWILSSDPSRMEEADAVVFHIPSMFSWSAVHKHPGQKWVAWSAESDVNYPHLRNRAFMARFDLTMTYRLDSDVPVTYIDEWIYGQLRRPPVPKTENATAVIFLSSTRESSGRSSYIAELMKYIRVDSYGKWKPNRVLEQDTGRETKLDTIARYKFNLAFENSLSQDYVSEKFFDSLIAGSVPVYLGASTIETFAPSDHCYINVNEFGERTGIGRLSAAPRARAGVLCGLSSVEGSPFPTRLHRIGRRAARGLPPAPLPRAGLHPVTQLRRALGEPCRQKVP
jgi:Glycosyltransferase family 10 (fucosyltransferase) C-term/Fucosyltransferase, N-terminal